VTAALAVDAAGLRFQNPVVLAAGTAAYGRELAGVMDLDRLGGLVTKAVSVEPRSGNPAVRFATTQRGIYMNEPKKPDAKKKDVRDLTPHKDAKGGRGAHGRDFGAPGRAKHNQL